MNGSWFEELESQLNQHFESFLSANPEQKRLLEEEELEDRQRCVIERQLMLQRQREQLQKKLLKLVPEINSWQNRLIRARQVQDWKSVEIAAKEQKKLMNKGKNEWEALKEIRIELSRLNAALNVLQQIIGITHNNSKIFTRVSTNLNDLENTWDKFESEQELECLRRKNSR
uniref:Uncharacterized protein n=1 Tax=Paulinella chromatophora TaxID=39717 RepID=B1X4N0_PAUCH|nr:hypothetical protein PCC_0460 [Paulinella chromatophora]ACB42899.1 hypothetical protein PCC_0460 [Paulinella chromatophora]